MILPALVLHESALAHNLAVMADYCAAAGVELAPHAKTHMSPELVARQIAAGAWGFTAATPRQIRSLAAWGVPRILHANLLVDADAIDWVATRLLVPGAPELLTYVDSDAGLDLLLDRLARRRPERPLQLLLELGSPGGRTGMRDDAAARRLAARVRASDLVELAGVAAFEGLTHDPEPRAALLRRVRALVEDTAAPLVTAGGSSYFDEVVAALGDLDTTVVLRSGCYLTHDHGVYRRTSPLRHEFRAALELRASVLSQPEDGLAIVGFGRREVPTDDRLPVVIDHDDWEITGVNDHHAFLRLPAGVRLDPGTVLRFGISHPCGAFDRWREIPVLAEDGTVLATVHPDL
ncbi:alanine racemase [Cellulomonas fimi]|uniref:alanine racemase n=1 Tax=Cellulomonas sp. RIT-PI-Y TaxID=3035297 RepID=UPI0021DA68A8